MCSCHDALWKILLTILPKDDTCEIRKIICYLFLVENVDPVGEVLDFHFDKPKNMF